MEKSAHSFKEKPLEPASALCGKRALPGTRVRLFVSATVPPPEWFLPEPS